MPLKCERRFFLFFYGSIFGPRFFMEISLYAPGPQTFARMCRRMPKTTRLKTSVLFFANVGLWDERQKTNNASVSVKKRKVRLGFFKS